MANQMIRFLAEMVCQWAGHKWRRLNNVTPTLTCRMKHCARCGITAPVRSRKPKPQIDALFLSGGYVERNDLGPTHYYLNNDETKEAK